MAAKIVKIPVPFQLLSSPEPRKLSTFDLSLYALANLLPWPECGSSFLILAVLSPFPLRGKPSFWGWLIASNHFVFFLDRKSCGFPLQPCQSSPCSPPPPELETPFLVVVLPSDPICNFGKLAWTSVPPVTKNTLASGQLEDVKV